MTAIIVFVVSYTGIALGKIPGLVIDRVGVALLGAIAMIVLGVVSPRDAVAAVDLPTILLLYSLMIVSAQLRLGGFYTGFALKIVPLMARPRLFLLAGMLASALLSAVLANDIVCFAFTPVLAMSLLRAGLNPVPFLIGLAVSSNIGSAATIIGNPQNMLIGQMGRLDFGRFFIWCSPPTMLSLLAAYAVIARVYRGRFQGGGGAAAAGHASSWPAFNPWQTSKGLAAVSLLIALFLTPIPREISAISIAGVLLCSRRMKTREILVLVDWHLITLFCALFVVIHAISLEGRLERLVGLLSQSGLDLRELGFLTAVSTLLSNLVSNVPAVMLLIRFLDPSAPVQWYTLAVSSTFAGNLFLLGSIANLIVVEQAAHFGIAIDFREHAAVGIPVTLLSLAILIAWIAWGV